MDDLPHAQVILRKIRMPGQRKGPSEWTQYDHVHDKRKGERMVPVSENAQKNNKNSLDA